MAGETPERGWGGLLGRLGGKRPGDEGTSIAPTTSTESSGTQFPTKALRKFLTTLASRPNPVLLDLGPVIGANVSFFGEQLGCKILVEDLYADIDRQRPHGDEALAAFFTKRCAQLDRSVDGILCWDLVDFLPPLAAQALAAQLTRVLAVDGALLGFFSTAAARETTFTKFVVADEQTLRHRPYRPGPHAVPGASESRHHQAVRRPARLRLVSAPDSYAGDTLPQTCLPVRKRVERLRRPPPTPYRRPGSAPGGLVARPTIALLTDFGHADHYAGTLKGVLLTLCPDATLVDITHDIPPHDVLGAALELAACYRYFPSGTIFLVVVDPGVGSARRGLVAEAGDYRFVAPDNGVLSLVFQETQAKKSRGPDRTPLRAPDGEQDLRRPRSVRAGRRLAGQGHRPDGHGPAGVAMARPGHAPTRCRWPAVVRAGAPRGSLRQSGHQHRPQTVRVFRQEADIQIAVDGQPVDRLVATYAESAEGALCALFGSTDHLEIALNGGSAALRLGLGRGAGVHIDRN